MALDPFQSIFGGSNTSSTTTSTPSNLNPFATSLGGTVNALGTNLGGGLPTYSGPLSAPIGANESNVLSQLMGSTGTNSPNTGYLSSVLSGQYLPGQPGGNPFLQDAITAAQRTTMDNLTDVLGRTLPGRFTSAGQFTNPQGSSPFDMAAALASRSAGHAMGDIAANMSSNAFGMERQNQQQAVALNQQEVQNTVANLQAQALPRMISELGIERGLSLFQTNISGLLQLLQTLGGITGTAIGNTSSGTSTGTTQGAMVSPMGVNAAGGIQSTGMGRAV